MAKIENGKMVIKNKNDREYIKNQKVVSFDENDPLDFNDDTPDND